MRWSRIKDIIILMLVIVNLFLLAMVGLRAWRSQRDALESRERMVTLLEKNGISYLPDSVPGDWALSDSPTLAEPGREVISASTALLRFLEALNRDGYLCAQITALYPAAQSTEAGTSLPLWVIETDTWPWRFSVNAYTGAVTTAE